MLAARLIEMIEKHADELTRGVVSELEVNPQTPSYHKLEGHDVHGRVFEVLRHFGEWLDYKSDKTTEAWYKRLGRERSKEGIPLREVVSALLLTKQTLRSFIRSQGLVDSAMELYQQLELYNMINLFFDRAIYSTVSGYEEDADLRWKPAEAHADTRPHARHH